MIKFGTGVKIRSGIRMGHGVSVEENPLVIWLTINPYLINIQYQGAGSPLITYTQGSGENVDNINIPEPTWYGQPYIYPFQLQDGKDPYKCVKATAWDKFDQPIASNQLVCQMGSLGIWLTRDPGLIHIEYLGAGDSRKITYTQGLGEDIDHIDITQPTWQDEEYIEPFQPLDYDGYPYKCVRATAWDKFKQPIESNHLVYRLS